MLYICLVTAIAMLAASPIRAADPPASAQPEATGHKVFVVRADPRTGRLVRTVVASSKTPASKSNPPAEIRTLVDQAARTHDVDPLLVHSIIQVESNYNPKAVSPKGAQGLMQLTPSTARMLGVNDSFDPGENIEAGVKYLKYLQSVYKDDRLALAAYNAGPGAVDKYREIPPYPETRNYVDQVGKRYQERKAAAQAAEASAVSTPAAAPPPPEHPKLEQFVDQDGRLYLRTVE